MFEPDNEMNTITVCCDGNGCVFNEFVDSIDFSEAAKQIKANGWRIVYDEDTKDFFHYCPVCKQNL